MSPSLYLHHVLSKPTAAPDSVWAEWHMREHLPDLVNFGVSSRATFYEEIANPLNPKPDHPCKYLAFYQTDLEEPLKHEGYDKVRKSSERFQQGGGKGVNALDNGELNTRVYKLIQEFDPRDTGEKPSPEMLTVEMYPKDVDDFEAWYREEHLSLLSKLPGYRRSLRYRLELPSQVDGHDLPTYLAIHEVDDATKAFGSEEADNANTTQWTMRHVKDTKVLVLRAWKLLHAEGY